jgi:hypothetical protein
MLWRTYGGPEGLRWIALLVGLTSAGALWTLFYGQNTGFLLLGLAGFVYYRRQDRPALAGAFAALTALKPHLLAVFGVLLVIDAVLTRRGRVALATGAGLILLSLGLAVLANPAVIDQYRAATANPGPGAIPLSGWALPVLSYWLRMHVDCLGVGLRREQFWIQFVPCAVACLAFAARRLWKGDRWDWAAELPVVVWVSVLTTPYGGWIFDLTVLLVPVTQATAWVVRSRRWLLGAGLAAGHLLVTAIPYARGGALHEYGWVAPAVLVLYLVAMIGARDRPS